MTARHIIGIDDGPLQKYVDQDVLDALKVQYGLGQPMYLQYIKWLWRFIQGDMGQSFLWRKPVNELIWGRVGLTFALSSTALLIQWMIAIPLGIYSAVRQYSIPDYILSALTFVATGIPHFLIALVLMWIVWAVWGTGAPQNRCPGEWRSSTERGARSSRAQASARRGPRSTRSPACSTRRKLPCRLV